jgi:hypothetical protein
MSAIKALLADILFKVIREGGSALLGFLKRKINDWKHKRKEKKNEKEAVELSKTTKRIEEAIKNEDIEKLKQEHLNLNKHLDQ